MSLPCRLHAPWSLRQWCVWWDHSWSATPAAWFYLPPRSQSWTCGWNSVPDNVMCLPAAYTMCCLLSTVHVFHCLLFTFSIVYCLMSTVYHVLFSDLTVISLTVVDLLLDWLLLPTFYCLLYTDYCPLLSTRQGHTEGYDVSCWTYFIQFASSTCIFLYLLCIFSSCYILVYANQITQRDHTSIVVRLCKGVCDTKGPSKCCLKHSKCAAMWQGFMCMYDFEASCKQQQFKCCNTIRVLHKCYCKSRTSPNRLKDVQAISKTIVNVPIRHM